MTAPAAQPAAVRVPQLAEPVRVYYVARKLDKLTGKFSRFAGTAWVRKAGA